MDKKERERERGFERETVSKKKKKKERRGKHSILSDEDKKLRLVSPYKAFIFG
jgi:hypothetical protein